MMKLQITDIDGIVLQEKEITLTDEDTLVMVFDDKEVSIEMATNFFKMISEGLENNSKLVAIPKSVELQVIKKRSV